MKEFLIPQRVFLKNAIYCYLWQTFEYNYDLKNPPWNSIMKIEIRKVKKVKWYRYRPGVAQRVGRGIALLFHDRGTRRGWVVSSTPRPHFTPGKPRYPFYRRLGGPQCRSGPAENVVPTGIRSRTFQSVVSLYTDCATGPTDDKSALTTFRIIPSFPRK